MAIPFSEFRFNNESNREGKLVLEAPVDQNVLDLPFNPGTFVKLDPHVEDANSARLIFFLKQKSDGSELVFEPQINASDRSASLPTYLTSLSFQFVEDKAMMSLGVQCILQ